MRISEIFKLGKLQPELDFVDIDISEDLQLFLDPYFLSRRSDPWSRNATLTIKSFFQTLINKIKAQDSDAMQLLSHLHEPNETCLGMSKGSPRGRGIGQTDMQHLYGSLLKSKAVQTGLVGDLEDCHIFVDGFGKDKLSDMTTGIIRKYLIEYTQQQAQLNQIPLTSGIPSGYFWDPQLNDWNNEYAEMLVVDHKPVLLVPKGVVSFSSGCTPDKYYNKFALTYLQNEHLSLKTALVQYRKDKAKTPYVTKKSVSKKHPYDRQFLIKFTQDHPDVFEDFKKQAIKDYGSVDNDEIKTCDLPNLIKSLIDQLKSIPTGRNNATKYHRLITGILELIFYPDLICPIVETSIHNGRKRIDITFNNAAEENFFYHLHAIRNVHCPYIMVECKNYTGDPQNPELDQLMGRFSKHTRGVFGILACRQIKDISLFLDRCKDTLKDGRGLIIPLTDDDVIKILDDILKTMDGTKIKSEMAYRILENRCKEIFMG